MILGVVIFVIAAAIVRFRRSSQNDDYSMAAQDDQIPVFSDQDGNLFIFQDTDNTV